MAGVTRPNPMPYICVHCGAGFYTARARAIHKDAVHPDATLTDAVPIRPPRRRLHGPFLCPDCDFVSPSPRGLAIHQSHHPKAVTPAAPQRTLAPGEAWQDWAACKPFPTDVMFPTQGHADAMARAICGLCTVRDACLGYALDHHIIEGVWGGKSERQRRNIRRQRNLQRRAG